MFTLRLALGLGTRGFIDLTNSYGLLYRIIYNRLDLRIDSEVKELLHSQALHFEFYTTPFANSRQWIGLSMLGQNQKW